MHPEGRALLVAHEDRLVEHPDDVAVRRDVAVLGAEGLTRLAQALRIGQHPREVVRMDGVVQEARVLDPLPGRVAEQRLDLRAHVDVSHRSVRRADVGHEWEVLDERAVAELRLPQGGLGAPALLELLLRGGVQPGALERERGEVGEAGEQRDLRLSEGPAGAVVGEPEHADDLGARAQRHADDGVKLLVLELREAAFPGRVVLDRERLCRTPRPDPRAHRPS